MSQVVKKSNIVATAKPKKIRQGQTTSEQIVQQKAYYKTKR